MNSTATVKPLGGKSYGSIGHLPGSRLGPADHKVNDGQARICTERARDGLDRVICTEKLDGSNVSIARVGREIVPLIRAGYPAASSPREQHRLFHDWAMGREKDMRRLLKDGERICGEWLAQAHGTRYSLPDGPFVAFDLMVAPMRRTPYGEFLAVAAAAGLPTPRVLSDGPPLPIERMLAAIEDRSHHGALDPVEGAVWRVERRGRDGHYAVDFLAKYVRHDKVDGSLLPEVSGGEPVWNWRPRP